MHKMGLPFALFDPYPHSLYKVLNCRKQNMIFVFDILLLVECMVLPLKY